MSAFDNPALDVEHSLTITAGAATNHAEYTREAEQYDQRAKAESKRRSQNYKQQVSLEMSTSVGRDQHESEVQLRERDRSRPVALEIRVPSQVSIAASETGSTSPSALVQFMLGDGKGNGKPLFCEMFELIGNEWREAARWVKYEEVVEHGGERWSKPHVASLGLYSVMAMRTLLSSGIVKLDLEADSMDQAAEFIVREWIREGVLEETNYAQVKSILNLPHVHLYDIVKSKKMNKKHGSAKELSAMSKNDSMNSLESRADDEPSEKYNSHFMKKLQRGTESANVLYAGVSFVQQPMAAFVRIAPSHSIRGITEVPIPTRFLFILIGSSNEQAFLRQIGRAIATVLCDDVFKNLVYKATAREDILVGIDEFLSNVTLLPPGEWDHSIRLEPPKKVPSQDPRKDGSVLTLANEDDEEEEEETINPCLQRTGRLFGGLIADCKRRVPHFASDFTDALHPQCIASFIFLFFACLTPTITFGGMLNTMLGGYMGAMESILAGAICGVLYGLFSGQPLTLLGSTGPVLVFEKIVYNLCKDNDLDYMSTRFWIGMWVALICILIVAFDLSAWVRFITRFTEESFAGLISIIFIVEAFNQLFEIAGEHPVNLHPHATLNYDCYCVPPGPNKTYQNISYFIPKERMKPAQHGATKYGNNDVNLSNVDWVNITKTDCLAYYGKLVGPGCKTPFYSPDVFFFSCIVFAGTFVISYGLKLAKTSRFGTTQLRSYLSDFAVIIAIALMSLFDCLVGLDTPKLEVPETVTPTRSDRGWLISPFTPKTPWWVALVAVVPAILATILIFMDQQITAVIVNRKDNKLTKGAGYHLDLFVLAIYIALSSFLGIPWYVASTVPSVVHVMSLKKESETAAPGEKPQFLGCREQRVTQIMIGVFHGLSVLLTGLFKFIPMSTLYGVFLFMGVSSLGGLQVVQRCALFVMPKKWQPDYHYLRHVPLSRVHLFTVLQLLCFIVLWIIKMIKTTSILFPIMLVVLCVVRKLMEYFFTKTEIKMLDDIIPEDTKRAKEDKRKMSLVQDNGVKVDDKGVTVALNQLQYNPETDMFNISREMMSTQLWKYLVTQATCQPDPQVQARPVAISASTYLNQNQLVYKKKEN